MHRSNPCPATLLSDPQTTELLTPSWVQLRLLSLHCCSREHARFALHSEPIAVALDDQGVAVVQQSIEDRRGEDVIAEDLAELTCQLSLDVVMAGRSLPRNASRRATTMRPRPTLNREQDRSRVPWSPDRLGRTVGHRFGGRWTNWRPANQSPNRVRRSISRVPSLSVSGAVPNRRPQHTSAGVWRVDDAMGRE